MRITLMLCLPLLLGGLVVAQGKGDPDQLVKQLAADDYEVRENATKKLIELGDKAVPALEKALKSEDLEVRLRAGRALRAIRGETRPKKNVDADRPEATPKPVQPLRPGARRSGVSIQMTPDGVKVVVTEVVDGKVQKKEYTGKSIEELVKKHPELKRHVGGFRVRRGNDPFDMDDFWKNWNKDFDEHFRRLRQDTHRDMERLRRLMEAWRKQNDQQKRRMRERMGPPASLAGRLLGMRAAKPDRVLNAQLELRGKGLVVQAIEKDSLAERLGLRRYDVLLCLNDRTIERAEDVAAVLKARKEGDELTAVVIRAARRVELKTSR